MAVIVQAYCHNHDLAIEILENVDDLQVVEVDRAGQKPESRVFVGPKS